MQQSEFKISIPVKSYDEKTAEKYRNCYVAEKQRSQILIAQIEYLNEDCVGISGPYLVYFMRNKPSRSVTVGPGRVGPVHHFKRFSWS